MKSPKQEFIELPRNGTDKRKFSFVRSLYRGECSPRFYGLYRRDFLTDRYMVMPVPFNIIAGLYFALTSFFWSGWRQICITPECAFRQGLNEGRTTVKKDLIRLVVAGRAIAYGDPGAAEKMEFDRALERFSTIVPWEEQPHE